MNGKKIKMAQELLRIRHESFAQNQTADDITVKTIYTGRHTLGLIYEWEMEKNKN